MYIYYWVNFYHCYIIITWIIKKSYSNLESIDSRCEFSKKFMMIAERLGHGDHMI